MTRSMQMPRSPLTRSIGTLIVGLAIAGVAQSAAVTPQSDVKQVEVRFGDLNLNNEAGAATLLSRLSRAAREVCDFAAIDGSKLNPRNTLFSCRKATLQKAVADVNHPSVTALYQNTRSSARMRLASR